MASNLIDKLLQETYDRARKTHINKKARENIDRAGLHYIEITKTDIESIISYNYVAIRMSKSVTTERKRLVASGAEGVTRGEAAQNVLEGSSPTATRVRQEASQISEIIFNQFVDTYNKKVSEVEYQAKLTGSTITILQPRNHAIKAKETILEGLTSNAGDTLFKNIIKGRERKSFTRRTQFLHIGRTVGVQILDDLKSNLELKPKNEAKQAALDVIMQMLDEVEFSWSIDDSYSDRNIYVVGKLGQTLINKPGEDSNDWTNLRPELEKRLAAELNNRRIDLGSGESSQPFDERAAKHLINEQLLKPLKKKGVKVTPFKVDKPKKRSNTLKKTPTSKKPNPGGIAATGRKKVVQKRKTQKRSDTGASDMLKLVVMFNQKLPDAIVNNMGSPALENRTGRFANSVRVTDITKTPQGFPSVGYTYQKSPYQTFESGYQQGSPEYDPRNLINKSIREVAAEFAIGRFYTRRV
jgi:hypothetical protein